MTIACFFSYSRRAGIDQPVNDHNLAERLTGAGKAPSVLTHH